MVVIKEVKTKKDLKTFIEFPIRLYKDNPYYTPPLVGDDMKDFNVNKNPSYVFAICSNIYLLSVNGNITGIPPASMIPFIYPGNIQ